MTMMNNIMIGSNPYHNAFYVKNREDLQYKYQRELYSFDIRFSYCDTSIVIARSYSTDIAVIDNKEKIMVMSKNRYSMTTGKQLDRLRAACPADYKIIEFNCNNFGWISTHTEIKELVKEAGYLAKQYLHKTPYKSKEWRDYNIALHNYRNAFGNNSFYKKKLNESLDYEEKLKEKRKLHPIVRRPESEIQKEKREKFEKLIADGVSPIVARSRAKYIEPEYTGWNWDKSQVFIWSGRWQDRIKTTGGISFEPRHAEAFKDFENYSVQQRVLTFNFLGIDDQDRFLIGCHKIPRKEMEGLREIWLKAKEKHDNKKD